MRYDIDYFEQTHKKPLNILFHILGTVILYFGLILFLWELPNNMIIAWLGENEYARWSTMFAVVMIIIYGSISFNLAFIGGGFMLGQIFLVKWIIESSFEYLFLLPFVSLIIGGGLLFLGHIIEKNQKYWTDDIKGFILLPAHSFNILFKKTGISL